MNYKNKIALLKHNFDSSTTIYRTGTYSFVFHGANGTDFVTFTDYQIIQSLKSTDIIKELLCLEQPAPASRYTSSSF